MSSNVFAEEHIDLQVTIDELRQQVAWTNLFCPCFLLVPTLRVEMSKRRNEQLLNIIKN